MKDLNWHQKEMTYYYFVNTPKYVEGNNQLVNIVPTCESIDFFVILEHYWRSNKYPPTKFFDFAGFIQSFLSLNVSTFALKNLKIRKQQFYLQFSSQIHIHSINFP